VSNDPCLSKPVEVTVTFKLHPSDLGRIARMRLEEGDAGVCTDEILKLWNGLCVGEHSDLYQDDPCEEAFLEFCQKIQEIRERTPDMMLLAYATQ